MLKLKLSQWTITTVISTTIAIPTQAQLPILPQNSPLQPDILNPKEETAIASECVRLDGTCLFKVADTKSQLSQRIAVIQQRLSNISQAYFQAQNAQLTVEQRQAGKLTDIYLSTNDQTIRLLTVTDQDANLEGVTIDQRADQIAENLKQGLITAKKQREDDFLLRQGAIAVGIALGLLTANLIIDRAKHKSKVSKAECDRTATQTQPIPTQLDQRQRWHIQEIKHRLFQVAQGGILVGGSLLILGLFPQTRTIQVLVFSILRIPIRVGLVALGTYTLLRLSYALIARFNAVLVNNQLLNPSMNRRVQLRIGTITGVTRGVVTISLVTVGIIVSLSVSGVNIAPLLAGVGILGVGISLASQNLIRDAINGFFIILEDQYAVGDVINVGDVGGLVEKMNLRITQLRDAEGRLITLPNSEIKVVANLSSQWSRADLNIPVAYHADVNQALELIKDVATDMENDPVSKANILETPAVLGVDNFGDRGVIIRVWIKTPPLKQWEVSREFRRRIKIAFDEQGISIPIPQQEIWVNHPVLPLSESNHNLSSG